MTVKDIISFAYLIEGTLLHPGLFIIGLNACFKHLSQNSMLINEHETENCGTLSPPWMAACHLS